jgi:hypothetical protein
VTAAAALVDSAARVDLVVVAGWRVILVLALRPEVFEFMSISGSSVATFAAVNQ